MGEAGETPQSLLLFLLQRGEGDAERGCRRGGGEPWAPGARRGTGAWGGRHTMALGSGILGVFDLR